MGSLSSRTCNENVSLITFADLHNFRFRISSLLHEHFCCAFLALYGKLKLLYKTVFIKFDIFRAFSDSQILFLQISRKRQDKKKNKKRTKKTGS